MLEEMQERFYASKTLNGHGQNGASERIPVSRDLAAATVNPHRLAAFARAVIGHSGSAP
jgi:hypothetical protein